METMYIYKWFAWYPVRADTGRLSRRQRWVWWEWVEVMETDMGCYYTKIERN